MGHPSLFQLRFKNLTMASVPSNDTRRREANNSESGVSGTLEAYLRWCTCLTGRRPHTSHLPCARMIILARWARHLGERRNLRYSAVSVTSHTIAHQLPRASIFGHRLNFYVSTARNRKPATRALAMGPAPADRSRATMWSWPAGSIRGMCRGDKGKVPPPSSWRPLPGG
jgi:hypothetical protein